ncbi:flagellar basal body rod protein FlgB [Roseburia sp. NSJ-9]|uniref:Flagellar basal body rod protein FlgB n=1 Tax=Roseburia lenta TaxID=2763061 RepID=A0ABR7GET2_9FIRM|nr:flagellar basal body rod protein FlgB [Roseburia lenta]MBC5685306.1 flagellar basal body rod protein FlgB [Roseburia lenta]
MINSNAFSYINVLDRAADASWTRETVIGNNIANVDTPGYKRQDVAFEDVLKRELKSSKYDTLQKAVDNVPLNKLEGRTYTDYASYSYRLDGNNVDIDTENVELASEQLRYQTLTSAVSNEFTRMNTAMQTP